MQTPKWLKSGILGGIVGAVALATTGFGWAGWVTASKANVMASDQAQEQVMAALVPICVSNANADPMFASKLAELKNANPYKRAEILAGNGWSTMSGSDVPNGKLARACAQELTK